MVIEVKTANWDWKAFILGPFWYFSRGMKVKGFWLLIFLLFSCLVATPFISVYCGAKGRGDWCKYRLNAKWF